MRIAALLIAFLSASPAMAFSPSVNALNPQHKPANASAGIPAVDDNLAARGYPIAGGHCSEWGHDVPCNNHYSTTRASTKYVSASDGLYTSVPTNVFALGSNNGGLIEEARTNDALWSRDMTNAAWVKTTMTTALNAVGIDGTANSATTLTATGASATAVQTITLASQADNYSVFLKRVTGSGTINLCLAATACGTATACTVTSTTAFTRCTVTATVLNPIVGIQIVTNGDAVIADFNQMEPGGFPTSPCLTTNATCTRAADNIVGAGLLLSLVQAPVTASGIVQTNSIPAAAVTGFSRAIGLSGTSTFADLNSNTSVQSFMNSTVLNATLGSGSFSGGVVKSGFSVQSGVGRSLVGNNGTLTTDANSVGANTQIFLGSSGGSSNFLNGAIRRFTVWNTRLSDATLKALTQ